MTAFNSLLPIPAFEPPVSLTPSPSPSGRGESTLGFGGANNGSVGAEPATINGGAVLAGARLQTAGTSSFTAGNQTTTSPISNPNILWGAAAAAMLGATLAEWQKKREEEAARLAALRNSGGGEEEEEGGKRKSPGRIKYEAMMQQKRIVGELQAAQNEKARQPAPNAREAAMLRREFTQSGHVPSVLPPAPKPPPKPAANKREEWED